MSSNTNFLVSSSPPKVEEMATKIMEKQGISSIIGSDSQAPKPSFRRTLSADMSSKTWLAHKGFKSPTMKKTASSAQLSIIDSSISSSDEEVEELGTKKIQQSLKQGVWSSIMSAVPKKTDEELPPPYVHPLVKKSKSSLSGKSLEICTESLGSETGSDDFSSNPSSEAGSQVDEQETRQQEKELEEMELPLVANYNHPAAASKKLQPRSFPPPLQSLQMQSRRINGRFVLEAVSVPSTKNFHAQRQDGHLRLTLLNTPIDDPKLDEVVQDHTEKLSEIFQEEENELVKYDNDEEMDEETEKETKQVRDWGSMMNVHRSALVMKKLNQNPIWSHKLNYTPTKLMEFDAEEVSLKNKLQHTHCSPLKNNTPNKVVAFNLSEAYKQQEESWVLRSCKEARRTLLRWEPFCIATS